MAYAERKGLDPDVTDALWAVIRTLDQAERGWRADSLTEEIEGGV